MTVELAMAEKLASCREVVVVYGRGEAEVRALDGVSVEVAPGESIALLGRSGSGKTTLLHVIGGLVEPTSGQLGWRGQPLASVDETVRGTMRARGIAYVFQGGNLLPHFTALENVAFAAHLATEESDPELSAASVLELVGLGSKGSNLPAELSGGEAQRVAIARALAQRPELLLCDEPTGHLDSDTSVRVLDLIDALRDELGFALVIATHDVDVASRLERTIELEDGRIVAEVTS